MWRNKPFFRLWLSYTVASIAAAALPTLMTLVILDLYEALNVLGVALAARTFGFIVGAVTSGFVSDRFVHKKVLLGSTLIRLLATAILTFCIYQQLFLVLYLTILVLGIGEGIFRVAYQAMMVDMVSEDDRLAANAVNTLSMRVSLTVAPLIVTVSFLHLGGLNTLLIIVFLWVLSVLSILFVETLDTKEIKPISKLSVFQHYKEGFDEALRHRWLMAGLGALAIWLSLGFAVQQILLPVISKEELADERIIGWALGAYSFGALLGSLLLSKYNPKAYGATAFIALGIYGFVPLALITGNEWIIYMAYFAGGVGIEIFNIPWFTAMQREIPKDKMGRVSSLDFLVSYGISPLSLAVLPYFIAQFGQDVILIFCGVMTLISALAVLLVPGAWHMKEPKLSQAYSKKTH
ncbi:MFS transporter [Pelistega suis]|uniref:MFS transporter n=1 Tax=Pelistega suis TaxID=1631957 RepID=UPI0024843BD5|nr:MFS transporter [Pelistega suis]